MSMGAIMAYAADLRNSRHTKSSAALQRIGGGAEGTIRYERMEGGHFRKSKHI